jgi:hypothetical protein
MAGLAPALVEDAHVDRVGDGAEYGEADAVALEMGAEPHRDSTTVIRLVTPVTP